MPPVRFVLHVNDVVQAMRKDPGGGGAGGGGSPEEM